MIENKMFEDSQDSGVIPDEKYFKIANLAETLVRLQERLEEAEEVVKDLKEYIRVIQEQSLPNAMAEIGLSSFKLKTGESIEVTPFYSASIPKANPGPAMEWLVLNGFGDLIKHKVSVALGRGKEEESKLLSELLESSGFDYSAELTVHPQTLKAFVKEQIEAGNEIPTDIFNIFLGQKAKVNTK